MSVRYANGSFFRASGTRKAFDALSARLRQLGHPAITVNFGDRSDAEAERLFLERYRTKANIKGRRVYDIRYWRGVAWYRISPEGTVAVPGTSPHQKMRAGDLAYPYNSRYTAAHRAAQQLAAEFDIVWTGKNFGEDWHWEYLGALGVVGTASTGGSSSSKPSTPSKGSFKKGTDMATMKDYEVWRRAKNGDIMVDLGNEYILPSKADYVKLRDIVRLRVQRGDAGYTKNMPDFNKPNEFFNMDEAGWALLLALKPIRS